MQGNRSRYANLWQLTEREAEVLALLSEGLSNGEIAARLRVNERTIRSHLYHLTSKLGVSTRTEAAVLVWRERVACVEAECERLRGLLDLPNTQAAVRLFERAYARVLAEVGLNGTTTANDSN